MSGMSQPSTSRRGATLIEMLVVIMILVILAGVAVPVMRPAMQGRRPREAARAVNVYLSSARNRALETGRLCGVMLQRMDNQAGASMVLQQVEMPLPYAGSDLSSSAQVQLSVSNNTATVTANLIGQFNPALVSPGDLIQFNGQGPWYTISNPGPPIIASIRLRAGQMLPWPTGGFSPPVPYQILRQPTASAASPLQLPMGMVVDLDFSGTDAASFGSADSLPVYILFSGNGSLERVRYGGSSVCVVDPLYLLIGRNDKVGDATNPNWQDMNNLWVTINPQTGMITTAPVAQAADPLASREFARKAISIGGG